MAKFVFLNLRERGEALRRAGLDLGGEILDVCDMADDWDHADDQLVKIANLLKFPNPECDYDFIVDGVDKLVAGKERAEAEIKRLQGVIEALQAEQGRLVACMTARGIVPPPPSRLTRPATPPRKPYGAPRPTLRDQWRSDVENDDVPF
jgi:hypothetical protein